MDKQSSLNVPAQYWHGRPGVIEHLFYGVFEGGGAKGVAYSGALLAMAESKCWFRAVAGASAGAITAALVASALPPEAMESMTDKALELVQTGVWAGLRRLRSTTGYFQSDRLRTWLNDIFKAQVQKSGAIPAAEVTFEELYAATRIELNVVATDLSLKTQVIFSHIETPNCAVADAVVASSSIPFAFPSRLLQAAEGEGRDRLSLHTIVDGGAWSNFPIHIFEDKTFRKSHGREPEEIEPDRVLGFLLQKHEEQAPPRGEDVKFLEAVQIREFRAPQWSGDRKTEAHVRPGLGSRIGAWVLYPFSLLGRFVEWNAGVDRGRWPAPRSRWRGMEQGQVAEGRLHFHPALASLAFRQSVRATSASPGRGRDDVVRPGPRRRRSLCGKSRVSWSLITPPTTPGHCPGLADGADVISARLWIVDMLTSAERAIAARRLAAVRPVVAALAGIAAPEAFWELCRDELSGVDVAASGWDIRARWFGVVICATPRLGELGRGITIPWRVIAALITTQQPRGG